MDNLVLHVLHEVALDGGSGCSWERFWYLVDEFLHSEEGSSSAIAGSSAKITDTDGTKERPPGMDDKFRQFFWTNIIQEEGFLFFNSQQQPSSDAKASNVTRASSVPADTLEPLAVPDISYRNVLLHYKDSIRIASCVERQQLALLGTPGNPGRLSTQAFHILQSITASREFGVTQALLAKEHSIDPRSMFHFLKVLIAMGLIVKIPVTTDGQYTLLCLHKDYAHRNPGYRAMTSEDPFSSTSRPLISGDGGRRFEGLLRSDAKKVSYYSGLIKRKLTDILGRSKTKVMTFEDLLKALDLTDMNTVQNRWFNRQIELLCKLKYIKRVQVQGLNRCIQLIRPFGGNLPPDEPEKDQLTLKALMVDDTNQSGIYIDTSIEHHVYKLIVESEEQGTIAKEIRLAMNRLNLRLLARILDTLCKAPDSSTEPLVKRVVEFVGRERRYRYYSQSGYKASVDEDHRSYLEKAKKAPTGSGSPKATTSSPSASIVVPGPVTEILSESNEPTGTGTEVPSASTPSEPSQAKARSKPRANKPAPATPSVNSQPSQEKALPTASNNATQESDTTPASTASALPESVATPERFVSMALLKRRKILLSLLERHKIVEYQASLVGEYQKEKVLLYPGEEETSVIDRRTLYRTVGILEEEGLCKIFKAQNLTTSSGGTTTKQFCLHSSLEPDSDIVKAFVRESTNRQLLFGQLSSKPPRKLEEVDIEVESLVDLQKRLGGAIENAITIPFTDVGTLRRLRLRDANKASTVRGTDFEGIQYAIQYGWFKAKMMRALVFHRYILDKLSQKDDTIYCRPDYPRTCSTAPIFEVLPLRVYLIAVGIIQEPTAQMHTFLEANRNSNIPLNQLPDYLSCLSVPTPYFRKRLREVFEIMDALGLVKPLEEKDNSTKSLEPNRSRKLEYSSNHLVLHTHYETLINVKAPLDPHSSNKVDDSLHDRKEYMLLSPRECKDFWVDLQTSASSMKTVEPTAGSKSPKTWSDIRRNFLLNLCNRRIWMDPVRITEEQRAKLMAHTDRKRFFVPVADELTIGSIAGETGLDKEHVVRFYRALLHNWNSAATTTLDSPSKTTRLSQVKKARQSLGNRSGPTQPLETQSTPTPSAPAVTPEEGPAKEKPTKLYPDSMEQSAAENVKRGGKYATSRAKKRRAKRVPWNDMEDETLLLSTAIVRYISETFNVRFSWLAVARAFGGARNPEICRHRSDKLMRESTFSKKLESYRVQFSYAYGEVAQKIKIDTNLINFDPSPIVKFFQPRLNMPNDTMVQSVPLPLNPSDVSRLYIVRHEDPLSTLYVEDRLNSDMSLPRRVAILNQLPPTLRAVNNLELDYSPEDLDLPVQRESRTEKEGTGKQLIAIRRETLSQEHLVLSIIKAVYNSPHHKRTRDVATALLQTFNHSTVHETCRLAKEWKLLVAIKSASYRIPGQKVAISERFSGLMIGAYPRMLSLAASDVDQENIAMGESTFHSVASPADMVVLMTDTALDRVHLRIVEPSNLPVMDEKEEEEHGPRELIRSDVLVRRTLPAKESVLAGSDSVESKLKRTRQTEEQAMELSETTSGVEKRVKNKALKETRELMGSWEDVRTQTERALEKYLLTVPNPKRHLCLERIYLIVAESGADGILLPDVKDALASCVEGRSDQEILDCVHDLEHQSPPIIMKVGLTHPRYIAYGWHERWSVNYREVLDKVARTENNVAMATAAMAAAAAAAAVTTATSVTAAVTTTTATTTATSVVTPLGIQPTDWIVPRMWRTVEGELDKVAFEKSLHAILTHVAEKPGISKGTLQKIFHKVLLPVEMDDLLVELESRKAVYFEYGIQSKPASLFSKRGMFKSCGKVTIDERKVTNIFPVGSYYSHLDMGLVMPKGPV